MNTNAITPRTVRTRDLATIFFSLTRFQWPNMISVDYLGCHFLSGPLNRMMPLEPIPKLP